MKICSVVISFSISIALSSVCNAQPNPKPENPNSAVMHAFETHNIVMFGEIHGDKQEYEWLRSLVANPEFADRVDDIVVETATRFTRNQSIAT